jgi:acyl-CoA reductase-like NAD-dependent aldehyde dehydrogenase
MESKYIVLPLPGEQLPQKTMISKNQLKGLNRLAQVVLPQDSNYPGFQSIHPEKHLNGMVDYMYPDDRGAILIILGIFAYTPKFVIKLIMQFVEAGAKWPSYSGALFRMLQTALKGLIFTLFYSDFTIDKSIHQRIKWDAKMQIEKEETAIAENPVKTAFTKAKSGLATLRGTKIEERIRLLANLRKYILYNRESIIDHIQKDTGKSRSDALVSEIFGVLDHLVYIEKNAARILKDKKVATPIALMGKKSRIYYEPLGIILIISPWNYPFYQAVVPVTAAIMAGNCVVYKPSEHTPLTGLIEKVFKEAGFDGNFLQVVYGDGTVGEELIDQKPNKIFFTGSERTGRKIMTQAAQYLIPVELELGGKDPMIVFDDVNIKRAAAGALWGGITNLGQSCTSVERIYVQKNIYDEFKKELVRQASLIIQETDSDGNADVGVMTTDFQIEIIKTQLDEAKKENCEISTGNNWDGKSKNIPPIVIDNLAPESKILHEETFGPVLPLIPFETEHEAITLANNSDYGLSASVWSKDLKRADRIARALITGNVSINNVMLTEGNSALPFGGIKNSGFGRYKGEAGLHSFCNLKSVLIDVDSSKIESNWFPYTKEKYRLFSKMTVALYTSGARSFFRFLISGLKLESYSAKVGKEGRK